MARFREFSRRRETPEQWLEEVTRELLANPYFEALLDGRLVTKAQNISEEYIAELAEQVGDLVTDTVDSESAQFTSLTVRDGLTVNTNNGTVDSIFRGDTDTTLLVIDAGGDKVGIGTGTPDAKLQVVGSAYIGEDGTNFLEVESDGSLHFHGTATVWDDLRVEPSVRTAAGGSKNPAFSLWFDADGLAYGGSASGSAGPIKPGYFAENWFPGGTGGRYFSYAYPWFPGYASLLTGSGGIYLYSFTDEAAANERELHFQVQMPHSWAGTAIYPHIHWVASHADTTATPCWVLEYTWADIGATFPKTTMLIATGNVQGDSDLVAGKHYLTSFPAIPPNANQDGLSSCILCRISRASSDARDTYNVASNACGLLYIDFHFEIDTIGSREALAK